FCCLLLNIGFLQIYIPKTATLRKRRLLKWFRTKLPFLELDYTAIAKCRYDHFAPLNGESSSKTGIFGCKPVYRNPYRPLQFL
ncbi:MAG: hypothetical protein LBU32_06120, partial [Clostridiales bacterium]|nr:hypothetical protein [Clostridiales bacterium]